MSRRVPIGQPFNAGVYFASGLAHVGVEVQLRPAGTVLVARTEVGVHEVSSAAHGALGLYDRQFSAIGSACEAWLLWDDNAGHTEEEELYVEDAAAAAPPGVIVGADPGVLTIDGLTQLTSFLIKRGDTVPSFDVLLRRQSGALPPLDAADTVYLNIRPKVDAPQFAPNTDLKHLLMTIPDVANARVLRDFVEADTSTLPQDCYAEVEVNYAVGPGRPEDGGVETFPQRSEVAFTVRPDLDPGVDP